jgi:membrane dipeptidase
MDRRTFIASVGSGVVAGRDLAGLTEALAEDKPYAGFRVVDTHLHVFNTALDGKDGRPRYIGPPATVEDAVAAMDYGHVQKAFLISYAAADIAVQARLRGFDVEAIAPVVNKQYQVESWQAHRDRFWWFTDHVDPMRESYLDELQRDFELGAAGVKLLPWFHGLLADHPGFIKVYELCGRRKKPIILDLSWWYFDLNPLFNESPARQKLVRSISDYARLLAPVFREFADVPFSLAHAGTAKTSDDYRDIFPLIAAHPNVSCDLAAALDYSEELIERLVKAVGAHKVMYGTDWPYWSSSGQTCYRTDSRRWGLIADGCPQLNRREKQQVLAANAERFAGNALPDESGSRAHELHKSATVIVVHDHRPIADDVPRMLAGGVTAKVYNIGVDVEIGKDFQASAAVRAGWLDKSMWSLDEARRVIASDREHLVLALSAADIERARRQGKLAIVLGVEGGKLLEGEVANLRRFYDLGLRELQLRWAVSNQLVEADSLSDFGLAVVRECQRLGIIIDLTHIPQRAFDQVVEVAQRPLIVSHGTGAELGEQRLAAVARLGGVVGIHFYSSYLGARPHVIQVLDAVDYLAEKAGIQTVALGVDFFPTDGGWGDFQRSQGTADISWAIPDLSHMPEITRGLVARGYSDGDIHAILGLNFLRVCREVFSSS